MVTQAASQIDLADGSPYKMTNIEMFSNTADTLMHKPPDMQSFKKSTKKHIKYNGYLMQSWANLSKEAELERPELNKSFKDLHKLLNRKDLEMNRMLNDADSSMLQLFSQRIESIDGQLTQAEKYERLTEFKDYLKEEFSLSNDIFERYINDEFNQDNAVKMLKYNMIVNKYTSKFRMSKKERKKFTLHEPAINMMQKDNIF